VTPLTNFLDTALQHASFGLYVFPVARNKSTLTEHGFKDASIDPEKICSWWSKTPSANPGFAPGASDVAVLDVDYGLSDMASFIEWRDRNGIPATYTVRSGSRPEFKVHMYFKGAMRDVGKWELDGCSGQVKSLGGYVLAAGSQALHGERHDKPGAPYEVIDGMLGVFADTPDVIRKLRKPAVATLNNSKVPKTAWSLPVHEGENRTGFLMEQTGAMRNLGCGKDAILARMIELNEDPEIIGDPVDDDRLERTAENCAKFPVPDPGPVVTIGGKKEEEKVTDWRERYHTFDEMNNAPEPTFIIDGFLQKDVISSIAAPVGQRKTIIAANVVHASLTGEHLFAHFAVVNRPARVLYLCPEMGLLSFTKRMRNLELMQYVGKTLFCRTMNSEGTLTLADLTADELRGALVVVDTAVRFVKGDENSSEHMKVFADECFGLMKAGAASVLVLFHSPKGTKEASELTLENCMRGSGDLGAFVSSCWATRLQEPDAPWESASYLKNVKQRDFESDPFEVKSDRLGRLHIIEQPSANVTLVSQKKGPIGNADGREEEALQVIRDNPTLSQPKIVLKLEEMGIKRSKSWVGNKRFELLNAGVKSSA
jgi:hypothetical protein